MRHVLVESWSRRTSALHRRDPRAKSVAAAVFLVAVATAHSALPALAAAWFMLLAAAIIWARLPLGRTLLRAALVLWFAGVFAILSWMAGDPARALALLLKSYLSALAVLLLVATTPLPVLLNGLARLGAPGFLLMVVQFLYRYLFVIFEEARVMRQAGASRGALGSAAYRLRRSGPAQRTGNTVTARYQRGVGFRAAAGALAALFARSYGRAEEIHHAMLARGFTGEFRTLEPLRFRRADALFMLAAGLAPVVVRLALAGNA